MENRGNLESNETANRSTGGNIGQSSGTGSATGAATAKSIGNQAQEVGQRLADAANQARDYVTDKVTVVGDKFKELQGKDFSQMTEEAKQYARQNPGQALVVSAAAGFLLGLLLRGSRR